MKKMNRYGLYTCIGLLCSTSSYTPLLGDILDKIKLAGETVGQGIVIAGPVVGSGVVNWGKEIVEGGQFLGKEAKKSAQKTREVVAKSVDTINQYMSGLDQYAAHTLHVPSQFMGVTPLGIAKDTTQMVDDAVHAGSFNQFAQERAQALQQGITRLTFNTDQGHSGQTISGGQNVSTPFAMHSTSPQEQKKIKEISQKLVESMFDTLSKPSAVLMKKFYCDAPYMVQYSIREKVEKAEHTGNLVKNLFDSLIYNTDTTDSISAFQKRIEAFFKQSVQGLDMDKNAVSENALNGCYSGHCENIYPNYNGTNLAVMKMILEKNPKLKSYGGDVCKIANEYA